MGACASTSNANNNIVTITSKTVAGEWFGQQVLDIADLHEKELEFEVSIYQIKLRELAQSLNCYLEIQIDDDPELKFETSVSMNSNNVQWKNFEKSFKYKCVYENLQKKFLEVRLMSFAKNKYESQVKSLYRVDLYTLAIGPVHHSIELCDRQKKYVGKLSCDVVFSEIKQVEVKLDEVHVKFDEHKDEAYNINFNVITFQKVFESNTSSTKISKITQGQDNAVVNWVFDSKHLHIGKNEDEDQKEKDEVKNQVRSMHQQTLDLLQDSQLENNESPYCLFKLSMDKVRYTSMKFKIWEDKFFKLELQKKHIHLDDIKIDMAKKLTNDASQVSNNSTGKSAGPRIKSEGNKIDQVHSFQKQDSIRINEDAKDFYAPGHHQPYAKKQSKHLDQRENQSSELMSECYIGFAKLLNEEMRAFDLKDSMIFDTMRINSLGGKNNGSGTINGRILSNADLQRKSSQDVIKSAFASSKKKQFSEKLWFCGQCIGEISGTLTFFNLPILYQMKVGVLTKSGIQFSSKPILLESQLTNQKLSKDGDSQIKKINVLKDKLILSDTGKVKQRLTLYEKVQIFQELASLLVQTHKNSMMSFIYSNEVELIKAQKIFIDLGLHCMTFSEYVDFDQREYYYSTLCHIMRRSELDLGQMGFQQNQTTAQNNDKNMREIFKKKLKVATNYQLFQHEALQMGIEKLNMKGVDVYKRNFVEIIMSISYFRVPEFRERFLSIILAKSDGVIEEWRNTEGFTLEKDSNDENEFANAAIMRMFDWKTFCYDQIPENQQEQAVEILQRALGSDKWKLRIQKRGVAFFLIIKQWAIYVKNTLVSNNVSWKDVPGYRTILKSILLEMKERDIAYYPEALKETTCAMLYNEKLLNIFVTIVLKKTHAFDTPAVSSALDLIASWFTTINRNKQLLPPQFDYMLLFKAIKILMDLDHGMSTAKCIWLLFKITHIIPVKQRSAMLQEILSHEKFFHYFFHWSYNVRMVFYYFYFFQLYHTLMPRKEGVAGDLTDGQGLTSRAARFSDDQFFGISNAKNTINGQGTVRIQGDNVLGNNKKVQKVNIQRFQSESQFSKTIQKKPAKQSSLEGKIETVNLQSKEEMIERLRELVANKNSTGSVLLKNSRLNQGESMSKFQQKFIRRNTQIQQLVKLTDKIKAYIKSNKEKLMKQKNQDEQKIFEIKIANNPRIREHAMSRQASKITIAKELSVPQMQYSASYVTESEDEDFSVPEERDWKKDVEQLKRRTGDFNIKNYIHVLTEEEQANYNKIIQKIPETNRIYIQYSLRKQFKKISDEYIKWLSQHDNATDEILDFPDIAVKVPRDEAETNVVSDEW
ncbi:duf1765 domain containing protein [Stylonychia lemnae]|uniref:Duf1765 domain containing protein n=1 Tax=Stylonychia lemnae TaxID=5949 RepID=A0A078AJ64_STYLE|nr:duf1765 domain containing protein [Stylonychia lemnae]|eukprot:CDW81936.1 duf1765 domain containing protein [Stylonychia lemnae]